MSIKPSYSKVAVGGTFDLLHKGHRTLLRTALQVGDHIIIGVTSDEMVKILHKPHKVDCFEKRKTEVIRFLSKENPGNKSEIIKLENRFGITTDDPDLKALVVSKRSESMASTINSLRQKKGLLPIEIVSIDMVLAQDDRPISTTRIRRGIINREGSLIK